MSQVGSSAGSALDFSGLAGGIGDIFSGIGGLSSAGGFSEAASIDKQNAALVKLSTEIQEQQQMRQGVRVLGSTVANASAGGGALSGSALDTYKANTQQLSLNRALVGEQGLLEQNAYLEQAAANEGMASAATAGGAGGIFGGLLKLGMTLGPMLAAG